MTSERKSHPYLRVWVADIVQSCQEMTPRQFGAHMRMLLHAWDRGSCSADPGKLAAITGPVPADEMLDVLDRWQRTTIEGVRGDVLINARLERERAVMIEQATARSAAGRRANQIRWGSQTDPNRIPIGSQTDPTPDTRLQTPDSRQEIPDGEGSTARKRAVPTDSIQWSPIDGWQGITDRDRADWAIAYPAVGVDQELAKSDQWLRANPEKARKKKWRAFLTRWFDRTQERGGSGGGKVGRSHQRAPHIATDCHPDDYGSWYTTDGRPRNPMIYRTLDGRRRLLSGEYLDEPTTDSRQDQVA